MKHIFLLLFSSLMCCTAIVAQTSVTKVDSTGVAPGCVSYFLPATSVDIVVSYEHVKEKPGPFVNYAQRFLGVSDVVLKEGESYKLVDINIVQRAVPDTDKHFQVAVNPKSSASHLTINDDGVILGVNLSVAPYDDRTPQQPLAHVDTSLSPDLSVLGEDALVAGSVATMAEMAAKQIYRIRENRNDLLSGDVDNIPDGEGLKRMLEEMDRREQALVALFVGRRNIIASTHTFSIVPKENIHDRIFARFSLKEGIVDADNYVGRPLYITIQETQKANAQAPQKSAKRGLYYNVPAKAKVEVHNGNETLSSRSMDMPQFGLVSFLPATLFNNTSTVVKFNISGAVTSIDQAK